MSASKGRRPGVRNYNKSVFINIVSDIKPNGEEGWKIVGQRYQASAGEETRRDTGDLKRFWAQKCCNNFKKPTGTVL